VGVTTNAFLQIVSRPSWAADDLVKLVIRRGLTDIEDGSRLSSQRGFSTSREKHVDIALFSSSHLSLSMSFSLYLLLTDPSYLFTL
jgi:hypothetical protein